MHDRYSRRRKTRRAAGFSTPVPNRQTSAETFHRHRFQLCCKLDAITNMAAEGSSYNDSNRAFLQAFLARSSLTFEEARPILAAIFTTHGPFSSIFMALIEVWGGGKGGRFANCEKKRSVGCLRPMSAKQNSTIT